MLHDIRRVEIPFETQQGMQFIDITDNVILAMTRQGFVKGTVLVQSQHTTARIWFNEDEHLLHGDITRRLEQLFPADYRCDHDNFAIRDPKTMCEGECDNGVAHMKAMLFPASITLIVDSADNATPQVVLGQWGRVLLVELDRARPRIVHIQMSGYFKDNQPAK